MHSPLRRRLTLSRSLLALVFVGLGLAKAFQYSETLASLKLMEVWGSSFLLPAALLIEVGGGAALAWGYQPRFMALLLAAYLIPVTLVFHPFWAVSGVERQEQIVQFLKNLSLMGGLWCFALQQKVLDSFLGGTLVQIRRETFERRRAA